MRIEQGLFDHIVVQRNRRNVSDAAFAGVTKVSGDVAATVKKAGNVVRGFSEARVGTAARGRFQGCLRGLPAGGPYQVTLEIRNARTVLDQTVVGDVLVGDVWIVAGQSNAQGCGYVKDSPRAHPRVRAFYMDDRWRPARDPIHNMWKTVDQVHIDLCGGVRVPRNLVTGAGPGVPFAQRMHERTGIPQGVLACAHGGTSMQQWDPALKKLGSKSLYGATARRVRKNGGKVAGVVWYQGCSDANPNDAPLYTDRMKKLVAALRRDIGPRDLPVALVQISRVVGWGDPAPWNSIQEQERRLPEFIRRCTTVPAIDLGLEDAIHISGKGQTTLGGRLADAMLVLVQGRRAGKPPIALKKMTIEKDGRRPTANAVVEFDNVVGKLTSGSRPSGFFIVTSSQVEQVYDVALSGNKAIVRTGLSVEALSDLRLYYGFGTNPVCNITDAAGRSLPVFGPVRIGEPRALTAFARTVRVSRFMPGAGTLGTLKYPRAKAALKLRTRTFAADFCDLHPEIEKLAPEDVTVYYACTIECPEPMKLAALIGYDGPVKAWIDGKLRFHDPKGINPAVPAKGKAAFRAGRGKHEVLIALGSNHGRAWGVFLAFERLDVSKARLRKGPSHYTLPTIVG